MARMTLAQGHASENDKQPLLADRTEEDSSSFLSDISEQIQHVDYVDTPHFGTYARGQRTGVLAKTPGSMGGSVAVASQDKASNCTKCMICLGSITSEEIKDQKAITANCSCSDENAMRHKACLAKWITVKGNRMCDFCKTEITDFPPGSALQGQLPAPADRAQSVIYVESIGHTGYTGNKTVINQQNAHNGDVEEGGMTKRKLVALTILIWLAVAWNVHVLGYNIAVISGASYNKASTIGYICGGATVGVLVCYVCFSLLFAFLPCSQKTTRPAEVV